MNEYGMIMVEGDLERIAKSDTPLSTRIVRLWAAVQADYGGPMGNLAAELLRELLGCNEVFIAIFQITGFCLASPGPPDFVRVVTEGLTDGSVQAI